MISLSQMAIPQTDLNDPQQLQHFEKIRQGISAIVDQIKTGKISQKDGTESITKLMFVFSDQSIKLAIERQYQYSVSELANQLNMAEA